MLKAVPTLAVAFTTLLLATSVATAGNGKGQEEGGPHKAKGKAVAVGPHGCPPGLAKKSPRCVPPGLAKKGDIIDDRFERIEDLWRYRLDRDGNYYRLGNEVFRVDTETREILEVMGVLADLADG